MDAAATTLGAGEEEFGALMCVRRRGVLERVVVCLLALVFVASGCLFIAVAGLAGKHASSAGASLLVPGVGVFFLTVGVVMGIRVHRAIEFYEHGAVLRRLGRRPLRMLYREVGTLVFATVRQFINGVYAGTVLNIRLIEHSPGRRVIRFHGKYKERGKRAIATVFTKQFDSDVEMDRVRDRVAEVIAASYVDRLAQGEGLDWCGAGMITLVGFIPSIGESRGSVVPYEAVAFFDDNTLPYLDLNDSERLSLPTNGANFYVGVRLMEALATEAARPKEQDERL